MKPKKVKEQEDQYLIWEYFHKIQLTKDSAIKAVCKFCDNVYVDHTKRLVNHLIKMCKKCPKNVKVYMEHLDKKLAEENIEKEKTEKSEKHKENSETNYNNMDMQVTKIYSKSKDGPRCFVYGCNRTKDEFFFFSAPKDPVQRSIWNSIIIHPFQSRNLMPKDFVCERHFAPSDVMRYITVNNVRIPSNTPFLRHGCLPIKFFDNYVLKSYIKHMTKLLRLPKKRKCNNREDKNSSNEIEINKDVIEELAVNPEFEFVFFNNNSKERDNQELSDVNIEEIKRNNENDSIENVEEVIIKSEPNELFKHTDIGYDPLDSPEVTLETHNISCNIDAIVYEPSNMDLDEELSYESDSSEDFDIDSNFFERIFETKTFPDLNEYWAIFPFKNNVKPLLQKLLSEERTVIFSQIKVKKGSPLSEKQMILTEDLKLKYLIFNHNLSELKDLPKEIFTTSQLADALNKFSLIMPCEGGPRVDEYLEIKYSPRTCYHIDNSSQSWRHNLCKYITLSGTVCADCRNVEKYLKRRNKNIEEKTSHDSRKLGVIEEAILCDL